MSGLRNCDRVFGLEFDDCFLCFCTFLDDRFNGGSALAAGGIAVSAVVSTQIGACCSGFVWLLLTWWFEKPSAVAVMNGAVAGLAGITPASGYIDSPVCCFPV